LQGRLQPFEEIADVDAEEAGDVPQLGRRDAVGALLVFLHLLEGDPQGAAQFRLIITERNALFAHPPTDMSVHQMRALRPRSLVHHPPSSRFAARHADVPRPCHSNSRCWGAWLGPLVSTAPVA